VNTGIKKVSVLEKLFRHPRVVIGVVALITVFFALQLPRARMNNGMAVFLPGNVPERIIAKHLEAQYGDEVMVMVGLERHYGTVFDSAFLSKIREFCEAAETIEMVKDTNSIMSTQYISSDSESIIVTDLVDEGFSGTKEEIAELKRRLDSWDLYRGSLISGDLTATQIVVTLTATNDESSDPEVMEVLALIQKMAKETFAGFADVYTAGQPVVAATLTESAFTDVSLLVPLVLVVLLAVLIFSFRRASFVILPLLTVVVAVIWAMGAMPLFNVTLTLLSIVLPVILIAVGSAYAIHVISHYKDEADSIFTPEAHHAFVLGLIQKLLKPVFLAALTTFAGFGSFCFAPLKPMRDFGVFASFGVIAAFAVAMTLVPAVLLIHGPRPAKAPARGERRKKSPFNFEMGLADMMSAVTRKKAPTLVITALVVAASVIGASKVVIDNSMVEFFNDNTEVSRGDRFIREHFGGSSQLIVSVEAEDTQTLLSPEVLGALDGLSAYLTERVPRVGKVTGFTDMVKRMNQMFNVDEAPEGIRTVSRISAGEDSGDESGLGEFGAFGFDESGFNEFGFDDGGVAGAGPYPITGSASSPVLLPIAPAEGAAEDQAEVLTGAPGWSAGETSPVSSITPITFAMISSAAGKHAGMSANELVQELKRVTNYEGYSYYEIPTDPARYGKQSGEELQQLVANYLVLLAGNNDTGFSNDPLEPTAVETIILVNSQWQADTQKVIRAVNDYVEANFPKNVKVLVGGGATQEGALARLVVSSQTISIFVSVLIVLLIVAFSNMSLAAGFIAALPLSIAIMCNFAVMGFLGITLNMATALIASLAVGIGIDYTIHFIEAFKREYGSGGDYLYRTFSTSGKAILINAVSVGAGFCVLAFSRFRILAQFGALVALSMAISAVVSLTVIPVLLTTVKPKFIYGASSKTTAMPEMYA
jgi:predicted RND superfamily exporter protein